MIGKLGTVVLDCPDPQALARFYAELLGWKVTNDDGDWVDVEEPGAGKLSFQQAPDHKPPRWPDPDYPQQFHIDFSVADLDEAEPKVLALGATRLPGGATSFRVYADPAGHPFCLCRA